MEYLIGDKINDVVLPNNATRVVIRDFFDLGNNFRLVQKFMINLILQVEVYTVKA